MKEAYGIRFFNRAKRSEGCDPAQVDGEFMLFAAMCEASGVAEYVVSVEYSSNTCAHHIETRPDIEFTDIGGAIDVAADRTLSQFVLFDRVDFKGGLDEPL